MNAILYAGILLILAVLLAGCTNQAPPAEPGTVGGPGTQPMMIPSLTGNWSGTMTGYVDGVGFTDYGDARMDMRITEQDDRIFAGEYHFINSSGAIRTVAFAGVIGRDGRSLTLVERDGGYTFGELIGQDEIELTYVDIAEPFEVAIDSLKRS